MSEDEKEIDIESDEDDDEDFDSSYSQSYSNSYGPKEDDEEYDSNQTQSYNSQYYQQGDEDEEYDPRPRQTSNTHFYSQAEKRAHHNALERKRRDHIKDSFSNLRDAVALLRNEKVASRAQILKKAAEYIMSMRRRNYVQQTEIEDLKRQNKLLESQISTLANIKSDSSGKIVKEEVDIDDENYNDDSEEWSESDDTDENNEPVNLPKKIKTEIGYY